MKNFINETKKYNKMKAEDLAATIDNYQHDIVEFIVKEGFKIRNAETLKKLHERMLSNKFPKALKKIIKAGKKNDSEGLSIGWVVVIAGFIEKNTSNEEFTEDLMAEYADIIDTLLKKRTKKIKSKIDIDDTIIKELLLIAPTPDYISNEKFVGVYSQKMLRKLYILAKDNDIGLTEVNQVKKLFTVLFGKKLLDLIAINILLEKKEYIAKFNESQTAVWNLMTQFALKTIDKQDKNHIIELLEYYCGRRRTDANKNRDAARRINKSFVTEEEYPNLYKGIKKFEKKGKESLVKFL